MANASMKEIGIKILCGAVVAMASGIGSILGSEGAKAGLKALQEGSKKKAKDPVAELPEPVANTDAMDLSDAYEAEADDMDLSEMAEVEPETETTEGGGA